MQFFTVRSPGEVRSLLERPTPPLPVEPLPVEQAGGRVLAADVASPVDLPEFARAVVDGFAVRAADTFGASAAQPGFLRVDGEVPMGQPAAASLMAGGAVRVATGAMLPEGADAVVMVEHTEPVDSETIEVVRPAAPGDGMVRRGDDIRAGQVLLRSGRRLRPQDLSALCAAGVREVPVCERPRVAVVPTGDEVVPAGVAPGPGEVRDANTAALCAALERDGAVPVPHPVAGDDADVLRGALARARETGDLVLLAGGSSVGTRDLTLGVMMEVPGAELLVHGVAIRPGKPLIVVSVGPELLVGLPGNPVSALIVYEEFIRPYVIRLAGEASRIPREPRLRAVLAASCSSDAGKEDYVRVRVRRDGDTWWAEPLLGKSSLVTPLVEADGIVTIPESVEGLEAGEVVDVRLF